MKKKYNIIDLFCGCGGLSYGFEKAGYHIALGIDNDEMALHTFEKNHQDSKTINGEYGSYYTNMGQQSWYYRIKNSLSSDSISATAGFSLRWNP